VAAITGLTPDPRRAGAVRVFEDGAHAWTVAASAAGRLGLVAGLPLTDGLRAGLQEAADEEGALRAALRLLGIRAYARRDLARRLERKAHPAPAVEAALRQLDAQGLIDDAAFARWYVDSRGARGRGPLRLRRDLRALGVADGLIEAALAATRPDDADPLAMPRALLEKRERQLQGLPRPTRRRRLLAYLARRGFSGHEVARLVEQVA
jgi:regulatory protein